MAQDIEALYCEAYALVDQGICYDEVGNREGALAMYERGLQLIDAAGQKPGAQGNHMYQKMVAAREHILYRLKDLRSGSEDASATPAGIEPTPYEAIEGAIDSFGDSKHAEELFVIPAGVQIFYIDGEETSVPSYPDSLKIFKFRPDSPDDPALASAAAGASGGFPPPAFLQVGDWIYPLIPGRSPVLHATFGAYIFPNPTVDFPEMCVGVLLPQDLDENSKKEFESVMAQFTHMQRQVSDMELSDQESKRLSSKISKWLITTGEWIGWGIGVGAEKTSKFVQKQSVNYKANRAKTDQPMAVDPRVQTSVHYLRKGAKVAVKVSGYLVSKVGDAALHLGKHVAKSAEKRMGGKETKAGGLTHDAIEVVGGGIVGASTVFMSLEHAARTLGKCIANETVSVVDHRYGQTAAKVTNDAMYAAGHGAMAAININDLGPKAIAKRTAKQAGIGFLKDLTAKEKAAKKDAETSEKQ